MEIFDKFGKKLGFGDSDEVDDERDDEFEDEREEKRAANRPDNVVDLQSAAHAKESAALPNLKVMVIEPRAFDDAQQIANALKEKRPVVINFENTDPEDAKRIIDFISGTTYALSGEIKKVGQDVFLCAPSNVNVAFSQDKNPLSSEMPWLKK